MKRKMHERTCKASSARGHADQFGRGHARADFVQRNLRGDLAQRSFQRDSCSYGLQMRNTGSAQNAEPSQWERRHVVSRDEGGLTKVTRLLRANSSKLLKSHPGLASIARGAKGGGYTRSRLPQAEPHSPLSARGSLKSAPKVCQTASDMLFRQNQGLRLLVALCAHLGLLYGLFFESAPCCVGSKKETTHWSSLPLFRFPTAAVSCQAWVAGAS